MRSFNLIALLLPLALAQDQAISEAETGASVLNTSNQAPAEATSAARSVATSIASEAFSSALASAASSISERVATSPTPTATQGAAAPTKDAQFAAMIGGGLAVAAGWFI